MASPSSRANSPNSDHSDNPADNDEPPQVVQIRKNNFVNENQMWVSRRRIHNFIWKRRHDDENPFISQHAANVNQVLNRYGLGQRNYFKVYSFIICLFYLLYSFIFIFYFASFIIFYTIVGW